MVGAQLGRSLCLCTTCKVRAQRAPLSIKYFNSLPAVRSPVHTCSCVRDRLIGPDAQIRRWSLDFLTAADQMASNGLFLGTKDDRRSSAASREVFCTWSGLTRATLLTLCHLTFYHKENNVFQTILKQRGRGAMREWVSEVGEVLFFRFPRNSYRYRLPEVVSYFSLPAPSLSHPPLRNSEQALPRICRPPPPGLHSPSAFSLDTTLLFTFSCTMC